MNAEQIVEAEALAEERAALEAINRIAELEGLKRQALDAIASMQNIGDLDQHITALKDQVKQFLALDGRTELVDGETGVAVVLQERKGTPVYDVPRLVQTPEGRAALLAAAEQVGLVRIDHKLVERARKTGATWLDKLASVEMPGVGNTALVFRERGRWQ